MSETTEGRRENSYVPGMGHDRLLPFYDPLHRLLGMAKVHRPLVDQAYVQPGHRILEIGCGTGNLSILVKRLHPAADVVGLDPDPKALARARRKAGRKELPVRLDRGFAQELPYSDASFDRVLSAFMFHHLGPEEKERALREVRRVLKPGGSLHLLDLERAKGSSSESLMARLFHRTHAHHRNHLPRGNFGDRIPTLMREAGFPDPTEVDHRVKKGLGRVAYYRATVPVSFA
ncbi:MAG: class I SAM-dependent methyltransferase [Actinomycetota bacterium]|nr:class I SAM-dependent methyltransferase [Actinomycetota bacterium]